jgi:neutral ceramidase
LGRFLVVVALCLCAGSALPWVANAHADAGLLAGAGKADITPPTGYRTDGWATNDRAVGTVTRLYARAIVLSQSGHKVALVTVDLVSATGGLVKEATALLKNRGFSESNVVVSGTHTHSGTSQFSNYGELNAGFPSLKELMGNQQAFFDFAVGGPPDPQVYTFLIHRLALAIARADDDLGPAQVGWSDQQLLGVTQNRSLEAHLANFGINVANHQGSASQDPGGYPNTIDPALPLLRVDKLVTRSVRCGSRRCIRAIDVPIGAWTDFANHGTVVKHTFAAYGGDHQAAAERVFEDAVRRAGHVPAGQTVVNAFADGAEGDMSSGLEHDGPAWADRVGTTEAQAMLRGWRAAGRHMTRKLILDERWTRMCFCGQTVKGGGAVDTKSVIGLPVFTGSEEGRGPLYDATGVSFEGRHQPVSVGPQGDKIPVVTDANHQDDPNAVPVQVIRVGDHLLADVPGEPTVEMGRRMRAAMLAASAGSGIRKVAIVGLANEYVDYYTTPAEYDFQDYEGGHTVYGRFSGYLIRDQLAELAQRLRKGQPAPAPYEFDPTNGVKADGAPYGSGAPSAAAVSQPAPAARFVVARASRIQWGNTRASSGALRPAVAHYVCVHSDLAARSVGDPIATTAAGPSVSVVARLNRVDFSWRGGPGGFDRPLDRAFISVQRRRGEQWRTVANDLGVEMLWTVDSSGVYRAIWQVPLDTPIGTYRFVVTANHYRLVSGTFAVTPSSALNLRQLAAPAGHVAVEVRYPPPLLASELDTDLTDRPATVNGGIVTFRVGSKTITMTRPRGAIFSLRVPSRAAVTALGGEDHYDNSTAQRLVLRP